MLSELRIHWKLTLLAVTFLAPVVLLTGLFIDQSYKDIRFAVKEQDGSRYLADINKVFIPLALGDAAGAARAIDLLQQTHKAVGADMNLGDSAGKVVAAVNYAAQGNAAAGDDAVRKAIVVVRDFIVKVGDGSNLILDPDLDSYYSMDLMLVRLPQAVDQAAIMLESARRVLAHERPSQAELTDLQLRLGEFSGTIAGIDGDLESAFRGSPDGSLKIAFTPPFAHFREAAEAFGKAITQVNAGSGQRPAITDLVQRQKIFMSQAVSVLGVTKRELDRLLATRIAGFRQKLYWSLGIAAAVLMLAGLLAFQIARSISRPVAGLVEAMRAMAAGDLSVEIPNQLRRDEPGVLAMAANDMRIQLHKLVGEVRAHADLVHLDAQKIAGAVGGQAATSSEMSASVAEITSTMEELSASSAHIADHSQSVVMIASQTLANSEKGVEAVHLVMSRMGDIRQDNQNSLEEIIELGSRSKEISKVMKIIDAVADQTRLIAFNAALEAASAGEAGRRFGVVAAEIRRLADSVTASTGEIDTKITQIQNSINRLVITSEKGASGITAGMTASSHAAECLNDLVSAAQKTTSAARQISLSTQQQGTASGQVVAALREIVTASSYTAQSLNQISDITAGMANMSSELGTYVGQFRLNSTSSTTIVAAKVK